MIVVTTPTGTIGGQVVTRLLERGAPVRVIARDPARLTGSTRDRVEVVEGSHGDPDVVAKAFAGADAVFWLAPPNRLAASVESVYAGFARPACEAFTSQHVGRVVGVSALGRGTAVAGRAGLVTASLAMDDLIAATGVPYRALALPGFMDNVLRQVASIRDHGVYSEALAPDRKLPVCATRDIAAAATDLLLDTSWTGHGEVPVLGPEDLSGTDLAQIMSEVLGRTVRYRQVPLEAFRTTLTGHGMSEPLAQGMVDMMAAKSAGLDDAVPRTPTTTSPTTFRQWCEDLLKPAVLAA